MPIVVSYCSFYVESSDQSSIIGSVGPVAKEQLR
jgi:hypothetical protein